MRISGNVSRVALSVALAGMVGVASAHADETDVVTVYGDRQIDDPGSYSVVSAKEVESARADHPAEILNTVPGVNIHMNSGQENLVAIRSPVLTGGAGQGSFLYLENGVPLRAPAFGNVNALFELHHEVAQAIEVVRGPGSVRYGSNAVHGMINVIAPEPNPEAGSTFTASANSLQRYRADLSTNFTQSGVDYFSALSVVDDAGWRSASGTDMQKLTLRSKYQGDTWKVSTGLTGFNLNQETAGFIEDVDAFKDEDIAKSNPNPEAYRDAWSARGYARFERDFGDNTLSITPFALAQRMIFAQHFLPNGGEEKNGQDSVGVMTRYEFGQDNLRWSVGADLQWADGFLKEIQLEPFGFFPGDSRFPVGVHYDFNVETVSLAAFAEADWQLNEDWNVVGGLRIENHNYDYTTKAPAGINGRFNVPPSREDSYDLVTPKIGVIYSGLENVNLYANYARGERAPQASDQYKLQNLQTLERLEVETIDSFEIGARGNHGYLSYDIAAYTMSKDNFFFRDADGLNVPDGATDHTGIEASLRGTYDSGLYWNAGLSWGDHTYAFNREVARNNSEDFVDGNQVDTAPEWLADLGIGYTSGPFEVYGWGEYVGEYYTNGSNTQMYDGHTVLHVRGSWQFQEGMEAFAIVRNLTDEKYADRADFAFGNHRFFPGEPLNATIGVRVRR